MEAEIAAGTFSPSIFIQTPTVDNAPAGCEATELPYFEELEGVYEDLQNVANFAGYFYSKVIVDIVTFNSCQNVSYSDYCYV